MNAKEPFGNPYWVPSAEEIQKLDRLSKSPRRLLSVFPHPDDESYGCAGTLARYGKDPKTAVVHLCLTSGEASSIGPERGWPREEVAKVREARMARTAEWLRFELLLSGLPDGELAALEIGRLAATLRTVIDRFSPQVVMGHDPRGINAHPDHIASHWSLRLALRESSARRFAMFCVDAEGARALEPRLLFSVPEDRIHATLLLTPDELARKEQCLIEHEALIAVDPVRAEREEKPLRPPIEQWEFFGEAPGSTFECLFAELPDDPLPV